MTHRLARAVFCLPLLTLTACPTGGLVVGPTSPDASVDADRATLDVGAPRDLGARVLDSGSRVDASSPDPWKTARGFAPTDNLTEHVWPSGYVGIEEYLNEVDR